MTDGKASLGPRWLLAIFLLALLLRAGNAFWLAQTPDHFFTEDAAMYWSGAGALLEHGSFVRVRADGTLLPETERVPGYSLFVAAIRLVAGADPLTVVLVQSVLDAVTCLLIALIGGLLAPGLGRLAGLLSAVWPNMVIHAGALLTETLFLLLVTAMLLFCARFLAAARLRDAVVAALLCGLALMVRPVLQFMPAALALTAPAVMAWHLWRRGPGAVDRPRRPGLRLVAAPVLVLLLGFLPASPWIARNLDRFDTMSLTDQGGVHLLYWVVPLVEASASGTPHGVAAAEARDRWVGRLRAEGLTPEDLAPFERNRRETQVALEMLGEMSAPVLAKAWLRGMAINLAAPAIAVDPRVRALPHPSFYQIPEAGILGKLRVYLTGENRPFGLIIGGGLAAAAVVSLLQAIGFFRLLWRVPWAALFGGLCIAYFLLITGPVPSPKYRLPVEPVLILFTAAALLPRRRLADGRSNGSLPVAATA